MPRFGGPRPQARGKFLYVGGEKLWVKGATYGAFRPDAAGAEFTDLDRVEEDLALMADNGFTSVRIPHTVPPVTLLDAAVRHGLWVMVGLSAEQEVGYLADGDRPATIAKRVRERLAPVVGHPAILCYALGNEIAAPLARWLGRGKVEQYLETLYRTVKADDPAGLVTYVNYPSTEYLELPFLDLLSFNVYLEEPERFRAYLRRLQSLAGDRPVLMTELGLDALRNGEERQAEAVDWQLRAAFETGACGAFVFSWTDEWHRAGEEVDDWAFGLTDRDRRPKPALAAARAAFAGAPLQPGRDWPRVSVVVCAYNAETTIDECLESVARLDYPRIEVVVVDDGSTDRTATLAARYDVTLVSTPNCGLSAARNTGFAASTGEIVAYLDSDAYPDPHWLTYVVDEFRRHGHAAVGGPNVPPPDDGTLAECVAAAPGGPIHVLLTDELAEHIPGCNMAIRRDVLERLGGFDPQFRAAGDDVDMCWRIEQEGGTIGFHPGAVVWHHRRGSVRAYWRQQRGYGHAEALLERKWPERYNATGHVSWNGRIYQQAGPARRARSRVYHGVWGSAPFQSLYERATSGLHHLPVMPEWWLIVLGLASASALGLLWRPLLLALPLLVLAVAAVAVRSTVAAMQVTRWRSGESALWRARRVAFTALLHALQPLARLRGRLGEGLSPWRGGAGRFVLPRRRETAAWQETWVEPETRLIDLRERVREAGFAVDSGGPFDPWDLHVRGGAQAGCRIVLAVEDLGGGSQHLRVRISPWVSWVVVAMIGASGVTAGLALASGLWALAAGAAASGVVTAGRAVHHAGIAVGAALDAAAAE